MERCRSGRCGAGQSDDPDGVESFADLWSSIDGNDGPYADYLRTLAAEAKLRLRRLIEAAYLDGEQDGPRSYAATAWAIKGRVP